MSVESEHGMEFLKINDPSDVSIYYVDGEKSENIVNEAISVILAFPSSSDGTAINYLRFSRKSETNINHKLGKIVERYSEKFLNEDGQDELFWKVIVKQAFEEQKPIAALIFGKVNGKDSTYLHAVRGITMRRALKNFVNYAGAIFLNFNFHVPDDF